MAEKQNSNSNKWHLSQKEQIIGIVFLASLLIGVWLPERISVATSDSVGHRVFFLSPYLQGVKKGDFLIFKHTDTRQRKGLNPNTDRMVKIVGCMAGDQLTTDEHHRFFCNETLLGTALETDSAGTPLPCFNFSGIVPDGQLFMIGTHPRSFDSKYIGFISEREIIYQALPLW